MQQLIGRKLTWEETAQLAAAMGISFVTIDDMVLYEEVDEYVKKIADDYAEARKNADIVLFCPHVGGQFNTTPGKYSEYFLAKCAALGFDAIFAAHSHTTQKAEYLNGAPCFYSMGNVTMSPCTFYQVPEALPEYGLCAHLYVSDKKIQRVTISIIKMVENADTPLHVVPIDALYEELDGEGREALMEDVAQVYQRVTGRELAPRIAKREYELFPAPQA